MTGLAVDTRVVGREVAAGNESHAGRAEVVRFRLDRMERGRRSLAAAALDPYVAHAPVLRA